MSNLRVKAARKAIHVLLHTVKQDSVSLIEGDNTVQFGSSTRNTHGGESATVTILNPGTYERIIRYGSVGLGESFIENWWEVDDLAKFLRILARASRPHREQLASVTQILAPAIDAIARRARPTKAHDERNISAHYDMGNEMFAELLDETMTYSSGIFENHCDTMTEASIRKLDRMAQLVNAAPGKHILEIGTGWGSFAIHLASKYGCRVTTTTLSKEQFKKATQRVESAGVAHLVTVENKDYRDIAGTHDAVAAIEMIEAVDWRNYDAFFKSARERLNRHGVLALQAIVIPDDRFERAKYRNDFIKAAIFPGGCLPSVSALSIAARKHGGFALTSLNDFGMDYAETLRRWKSNMRDNKQRLKELGFDDRKAREWDFYLSYCEAGFSLRDISVAQIVFHPLESNPNDRIRALKTDADLQLLTV